jgi:hypothetical protein
MKLCYNKVIAIYNMEVQQGTTMVIIHMNDKPRMWGQS